MTMQHHKRESVNWNFIALLGAEKKREPIAWVITKPADAWMNTFTMHEVTKEEFSVPRARWCSALGVPTKSCKVERFIQDLLAVYAKHGLSIGHEDEHGSFIIAPLTSHNCEWLNAAIIDEDSL